MSVAKRITQRATVVRGAVKETAGRVTGNRRLRASGRRDQGKGNARLLAMKIKDAFTR